MDGAVSRPANKFEIQKLLLLQNNGSIHAWMFISILLLLEENVNGSLSQYNLLTSLNESKQGAFCSQSILKYLFFGYSLKLFGTTFFGLLTKDRRLWMPIV